ncbi:hypothetical protein KHP60_15255 [Microvirga sp. 3-52]|jgi:hypothetical protein|uniref:hypothetical protein n=1 Tax=Microvirga sp. 3-52 TaxID=2792425 RepID=UPI001AC86FCF|nr:hypothetical protein [Microvirga sp. 3-52]MBO1906472.1 hypothetical protein [Microvirga sp. 3-52]MBS7453689.1 hypothetical protein [Microvirga sp. 3-52]
MRKLLVTISVALLAATSFGGAADARPGKGKGHAYGHYKNHKAQRYYVQRRNNNNAAIAAGVTGAILGGALATTARPAYRTYDRPRYRTYEAPRRSYYREEYYDDGY